MPGSVCESVIVMVGLAGAGRLHQLYAANETGGIDGQRTGNGTAFSAVAPSERPVFAAHQIRSSGVVIARIAAPQRYIVLFGSARVLVGEQVWPVCYIPPRKSRACFNDLKMQ